MARSFDETDGKTAETALTITQADIRLKKNGGAWAQKNAAQTLSHEENGWYELTLDATDTDTLGILLVAVHESGALPVWVELSVLPANVYDSMFSTDKLEVDVAQFGGSNLTASGGRPEVNATHWAGTAVGSTEVRANLINVAGSAVSTSSAQIGVNVVNAGGTAWGSGAITAASIAADAITSAKIATGAIDADALAADAIDEIWDEAVAGTLTARKALAVAGGAGLGEFTVNDASATATSFVTDLTSSVNDFYADMQLTFTSGALAGQARVISAYNGTTKAVTLDEALTSAPANGVAFVVSGPHTHTKTQIASAVRAELTTELARLDAAVSSRSTVTTAQVNAECDTALADVGLTSTVTGRIDATVSSRLASASYTAPLDAAGVRTAVGLASANLDTQLSAIDDYLDTEIAAIKAVTDLLTAAQAEPTAAPAANATPLQKIAWLAALARNKLTQTATTQTLLADDGTTAVATSSVSDDGSTFTRGKWS